MATIGADWSGLWRRAAVSACHCWLWFVCVLQKRCRDVDLTLSHEQMFWPVAPASSFPKPFLSSPLPIILTSSPLHFFPFSLLLLLSDLVSLLTRRVTNLADFVPQVIIFSQCLVEQIVSLAVSAITTAVFAWLAVPLTRVTRIPNKAVLILSCAI